jgi:hypothetical protein
MISKRFRGVWQARANSLEEVGENVQHVIPTVFDCAPKERKREPDCFEANVCAEIGCASV